MVTLIEFRNGRGVIGRCDAKCYTAQHPDCDCICGGRNHGTGLQRDIENTRELAEGWLERCRAAHPDACAEVAGAVRQIDLFGEVSP